MSADTYSRPEMVAERMTARRIREQIEQRGGCALCLHRHKEIQGWGRSICGLSPPRAFPNCALQPGNEGHTFRLDEAAVDPINPTTRRTKR